MNLLKICRFGVLLVAAWCLPHWAECAVAFPLRWACRPLAMAMTVSDAPPMPAKEKASDKAAGRVGWQSPRIAFEMSGKRWEDVFQWLADKSGTPFRSDLKPPRGSVTFISPKGKKYSLMEIYDILNEDLQTKHKLHLVRGKALTLIRLNNNIPPKLVDKVALGDLKKRGHTEIVVVEVTPLREVSAKEIKGKLGDFSRVTPMENSKKLTVQARVGDLQRVFGREIEKAEAKVKKSPR